MNKFHTFIIALLVSLCTFAQAPQKMSYQALVRNSSGNLVTNQQVGMQISILQTTATGTAVYVETQTPTTNANGLVSIEIGMGSVVSGDFSAIDWSAGPYFIKTETDPTGGSGYTITGTQQMMSVPYALYAQSSGSGSNVNWTLNSGDITAVGTTDVIATSSLGVGTDLTSGFDFGANTIVLRENNTRILFEDSSTPGGTFPSTDWRLTANDQANGGENYFSIDNVTDTLVGIKVKVNGTLAIPTPGAQLGIGTDNPALSIHAKSGNTPSIRLEQDVSGGYSAEIWDIIANEETFAVRNSSQLPFKIIPDAQENSLVVTSTGVGVGTQNPLADLHVNGSLVVGVYNTTYTPASTTDRLFVIGNGSSSSERNDAMVVLKNGNTGIGVSAPTYTLQVNGEPAANGYTQFTNYSDARLKTNITDLESSLQKIMALRPISYNYNETYLKLYNDPTSLTKVHKGFIAQEIKEVFPEMVGTVNIEGTEYFDLNLSNLPVYTIKAIQEQQALIQQLLQRIEHLENR